MVGDSLIQLLKAEPSHIDILSNFQKDNHLKSFSPRFKLRRRIPKDRFSYDMVDQVPTMIWLANPNRTNYHFNETWLKFTGRSLDDELNNAFHYGVHPDDQKESFRIYDIAFRKRKNFEIEYRLKKYDGNYRWVKDRGRACFTPGGKFLGYIGSCIDITEQKQIYEELQDKLNQQAALSAFGEKALLITNTSELLEEACKTITDTLHVQYSTVLKSIKNKELIYESGNGWEKGVVGNVRIDGSKNSLAGYTLYRSKPITFQNLTTERKYKIPSIFIDHGIVSGMNVIIYSGKKVYGLLGAYSTQSHKFRQDDINFLQSIAHIIGQAVLKQEIEDDLQESEERSRLIVEGVKDYAIFTFDLNGTITSWNNAAEIIFGYKEEEIVGKSCEIIFTQSERKNKKLQKEIESALYKDSIDIDCWYIS